MGKSRYLQAGSRAVKLFKRQRRWQIAYMSCTANNSEPTLTSCAKGTVSNLAGQIYTIIHHQSALHSQNDPFGQVLRGENESWVLETGLISLFQFVWRVCMGDNLNGDIYFSTKTHQHCLVSGEISALYSVLSFYPCLFLFKPLLRF